MEESDIFMEVSTLLREVIGTVVSCCGSSESKQQEAKNGPKLFKRRKIRKVQKEDALSSVTLDARQQEKERIERLKQLRRSNRSPLDETAGLHEPSASGKKEEPDVIVISDDDDEPCNRSSYRKVKQDFTNDERNKPDAYGRLLINVGHPSEDPDIFVPKHLENTVKRHQLGGVRFLYENVIETLGLFETSQGFGCILAHSMGLGKTLQVIVFVNALLEETKAKKVLTIVPLNTLQNWIHEFERWLPKIPEDKSVRPRQFDIFLLNDTLKTIEQRCRVVEEWHNVGGVLIMGYEIFRILVATDFAGVNRKRKRNKKNDGGIGIEATEVIDIEEEELHQSLAQKMRTALLNPGPEVVICDEGHRIKNINTATAKTLDSIRTRRRVVLTGYPIQNNLMEYWCMVNFVRPMFLGSKSDFANMFERPIKNGQCLDSTSTDVKLSRYRTHVLITLLKDFVQRRSHTLLRAILPVKTEYVILLRKSPIQHTLYRKFLEHFQGSDNLEGMCINPVKAFAVCCKIWNHPDILKKFMDKSEKYATDKDLELPEIKPVGAAGGDHVKKEEKLLLPPYSSTARPDVEIPAKLRRVNTSQSWLLPSNYDWAEEIMKNYEPNCLENGYKMVFALRLLAHSVKMGDKVLLFSQSLFTLNLIEEYLGRGVCGSSVAWKRNKNYFREPQKLYGSSINYVTDTIFLKCEGLDGSTSALERHRLISRFNNEPGIHLFLISTRAGSLGINLCGANRVIVFDASWNPCHDAQAVCRIYRYGQRKPCFVYRLVTDNSMERAIFSRQIGKQGISDRVIDEKHVDLHVSKEELENLMNYDEDKDFITNDWDTSQWILDDPLLQYVCAEQSKMLSQEPIKHESLFLDSREAVLTDIEKKEAERSYNQEKMKMKGGMNFGPSDSARVKFHVGEYSTSGRFRFVTPFSSHQHMPQKQQPAVAVVRPLKATPFPMRLETFDRNPRNALQVSYGGGTNGGFRSHYTQQSVPLPSTNRSMFPPSYGELQLNHGNFRPIAPAARPATQIQTPPPVLQHILTTGGNLPSITYPGMTFPIPPGQMGTLVRTTMGIYLRLPDGHVLDAQGSSYDTTVSHESRREYFTAEPLVPNSVQGGSTTTSGNGIRDHL